MLVLSRQRDESIVIPIVEATVIDREGVRHRVLLDEPIRVMIVEVRGDKVRLGIEAPKAIPVHREEVQREIDEGQREVRKERIQRLRTAT